MTHTWMTLDNLLSSVSLCSHMQNADNLTLQNRWENGMRLHMLPTCYLFPPSLVTQS